MLKTKPEYVVLTFVPSSQYLYLLSLAVIVTMDLHFEQSYWQAIMIVLVSCVVNHIYTTIAYGSVGFCFESCIALVHSKF